MYIQKHSDKWEDLHKDPSLRLKHPSESVIRFIKSNYKDPSNQHILDLGCGGGRHTIFLAEEGYRTAAIDFSESAIKTLEESLKDKDLKAELANQSIISLPFDNDTFDGIISFAVIYYFLKLDIKQIIKEIHRTLKVGGKAFLVVRTNRDKRFGQGSEVERNTFRMQSNFTNEQDMIIHFFDLEEIYELFSDFMSIQVGIIEESMDSLTTYNSDYLITVTK